MGTVQVVVGDAALTEQVLALLAECGVTAVPQRDDATRLVICDAASAPRNGGSFDPPVVVVTGDTEPAVWQRLADAEVEQLVPLPVGAELLRRRLRRLARPSARPGRLIRVVGARGGCGASTLAVGLAVALTEVLPTALVDGDPSGPGLELPLALAGGEGIRWRDLADVRGRLPATTLTSRLPRVGDLAVLSHRVDDGTDVTGAWSATIESLFGGFGAVVADVPRFQLDRLVPVGAARDVVVLPLDLAGLTCARRLLDSQALAPAPILAVRGVAGPVRFGAVVDAFPTADVVSLPSSGAVTGAADFGDLAHVVGKGGFGRICRTLADALVATPGARRPGGATRSPQRSDRADS